MQSVNQNVDKPKLANTLASYFNDNQNLNQYLAYCKKYDVSVISRAFNEVKKAPKERTSKSPNALFFYLVKKYAHQA